MTKATETSNSSPTSPHTRPVPISSPPPLLLQVYRNRKAQGSSRVATQRLTSSEGPASSWDHGFPLLQISCRHLVQPFPQFSCPLLTVVASLSELWKHDQPLSSLVRYPVPEIVFLLMLCSRCLYLFRRENNLKLYIFILLYRKKIRFQKKKRGFINNLPILVNIAHGDNPFERQVACRGCI